jgi:23S rRNA (cytidine1920-2'-O)/16S rRNA (cytidine1409-2'-O)-methyltransferase
MAKERLDVLVAERGLAESRAQAQRLIRAGRVRVDGQVADKPGSRTSAEADITLKELPPFVSRGGEKLAAALDAFELDVRGAVCADVGASTGGFTDCLLQRGVCRVYAIDVGYGQLDWRLRNDERVVVMERTNARYLEQLPEPIGVATIDVSFISLDLILPQVVGWLAPRGAACELGAKGPSANRESTVIALIKPQFEAGRRDVHRGGVVRDPEVHRRVLTSVLRTAERLELGLYGLMASPLRGPAGNVEFLAWWQVGVRGRPPQPLIAASLEQAETIA